ncbi:MAG TPA: zinc ABC transporter substrate-binding protein [Verrucomicrobiae bacterium]|nr:zinc ABC transporter substrate-binding protein [Verrucomicrobiae bacterium]
MQLAKYQTGVTGVAMAIIIAVAGVCASGCRKTQGTATAIGGLQIVAAENFWGSLVSQLAGPHAQVMSIVTDPNADPHEYSTSVATARAVATADYVVLNGAGYDTWCEKLLGADANPHRKALNVADLLGQKAGGNPHFWYNPDYVNQVAAQMEHDLISIDPKNADDYRRQYQTLQASLVQYQNRIQAILRQFKGKKVAATEDIFVYLGKAAGLDVISPPAFMEAVAEGIDPPVQSVIEFQNQIKSKQPAVLVYNEQTVTPLTEGMKKMAAQEGIPIVGITETIQPPDASFENWMDAEIAALQKALQSRAPGK